MLAMPLCLTKQNVQRRRKTDKNGSHRSKAAFLGRPANELFLFDALRMDVDIEGGQCIIIAFGLYGEV
jgi:hypothetical protein